MTGATAGAPAWRATAVRLAVVGLLAIVVAAFLAAVAVRHNAFDLKVYEGALRYWVHDGGNVYDYVKPDSRYGFTYPPLAAVVMLPMAYLPWSVVVTVSTVASGLALVLTMAVLVEPVARRESWPRWFAVAVAVLLAAATDPVRETVSFGQVNLLLLALVVLDLWLLAGGHRWHRWAGAGIGLATAVKLTPGVFIAYLLVTRRWRAAAIAGGTAAAATLLAAALFPAISREYWTSALWNTDRIGDVGDVSNQSLLGAITRLGAGSTALWLALVAAAVAVWLWRLRRAAAVADDAAGVALTGVLGCLVSPVSWVHHLVWLAPAMVVLLDRAVAATGRRRWWLLLATAAGYGLLCGNLVWVWRWDASGWVGGLGSSAYTWLGVALLLALPIRPPASAASAVPPSAASGPAPSGSASAPGSAALGSAPAPEPVDQSERSRSA